jgi:hypothetical protein
MSGVFPRPWAATKVGAAKAMHSHENKNGTTAGVGPSENGLSQGKSVKMKVAAISIA